MKWREVTQKLRTHFILVAALATQFMLAKILSKLLDELSQLSNSLQRIEQKYASQCERNLLKTSGEEMQL